jgi:hypothetical protein
MQYCSLWYWHHLRRYFRRRAGPNSSRETSNDTMRTCTERRVANVGSLTPARRGGVTARKVPAIRCGETENNTHSLTLLFFLPFLLGVPRKKFMTDTRLKPDRRSTTCTVSREGSEKAVARHDPEEPRNQLSLEQISCQSSSSSILLFGV